MKCKRCGWRFNVDEIGRGLPREDELLLENIGLCHTCHHTLIALSVNPIYQSEIQSKGYTGWDNHVRSKKK